MSNRIKSRVVRETLNNKDVLEMFQGVLGVGDGVGAIAVTHPKYLKLMTHADRFVRLLDALRVSPSLDGSAREALDPYVAALKHQFAERFSAPDLSAHMPPAGSIEAAMAGVAAYKDVPPELAAEFGRVYAEAKQCSLVNTIMQTCKVLLPHKKSLQDKDTLGDRFLTRSAGLVFSPLPGLPQLNFKSAYLDDRRTEGERQYLLLILHKLYCIGQDLYDTLSSPDVDLDEFIEVILKSIESVKRIIPRCDQAFAKIADSVDLLRNNFDSYHKDFTASGNPTIIMENFVIDVSKNTKATPTIAAQFSRIIAHYRKMASQQASQNPKIQTLFTQVDANFRELEQRIGEQPDGEQPDEEQPDGEQPDEEQPGDDKKSHSTSARRREKRARAKARAKAAAAAEPTSEPGLAEEFDAAL